ncbi:MAG: cation:proton antiporter [Bacteroidetes bacterium]|nr:cation:proton antiporter [Bacteroidota bacterium]
MGKYRNLIFYITTIGGFSLLMYFMVLRGEEKEAGKLTELVAPATTSTVEQFQETMSHNVAHPLAILLLQIITIILAARVFGFLCKKIGQPAVIGEIAAGIILGPSLVGMYFPEFSDFLFPAQSLGNLQFLSQIGLILFMFVIGMELDLKVLKNQANEAVVISHASIIIPFSLGVGLAYFIYESFAGDSVRFLPFSLFIGIAMSVTAFPVLARIVQERGLSKTKLGTVVITCAAADDITAWCILAAVIAIVKAGTIVSSVYTILMAAGYVLLMLKVVQPFLKRLGDIYSSKEGLSKPVVAIFFITLLLSAYATEVIGIHALFGAFMAGVIMPSNQRFRNIFIEKVEDVAQVLLLPLFFVFTGLRTQIGLLNEPYLWQICGLIILVAVVGKFVGSALAAKFVGQNWRDSLTIGALMNTRGLMELVVLNIGYDLGVLTPEVFAMMVIMALVTTVMTGPALDLINKFLPEKTPVPVPGTMGHADKFDILISFANPQTGKSMLRLASSLTRKSPAQASVTALHVTPSNELNQFNTEEYERESFQPIEAEAQHLQLPLSTLFKPSQDIDREITDTANLGKFDLLLVGMGNSMFEGTILGKILGFTTKIINPEKLFDALTGKESLFEDTIFDDRTQQIIKAAKMPVGILIDRGLSKIDRMFIPLFAEADGFLLEYAQKMMFNNETKATLLDASGILSQAPELRKTVQSLKKTAPLQLDLTNKNNIEKEFLEQQDLMLISLESWKRAVETQSIWLSYTPSVLIVKPV